MPRQFHPLDMGEFAGPGALQVGVTGEAEEAQRLQVIQGCWVNDRIAVEVEFLQARQRGNGRDVFYQSLNNWFTCDR